MNHDTNIIMHDIISINGASSKQGEIVSSLRRAVGNGELAPGSRLPTRAELEATLDAGRTTIQKALDQLARDGFTHARGKLGTFISDYPPSLCRYGIVFADSPRHPQWGGYHEALRMVGHEFVHAPEREVEFYFDVYGPDRGDYNRLLADIQAERLAGVFFTNGPWALETTPVVQQEHVPCMALMTPEQGTTMPQVVTACLDDSLMEDAVNLLGEKGCRRPAVLVGKGFDRQVQRLRLVLAARDVPYDPAMLQGVDLAQPESAEHVTALWMRLPKDTRPDGLFIADDNLVDWACSGLLHAGVHPGVDMPVVVHSNFPTRAGSSMPLDRVGFDIRTLVRTFIEITNARRRGEPFEQHISLRVVHEDEAEAAAGSQEPGPETPITNNE